MGNNDRLILDQIFQSKKKEVADELTDNEYFELFTAEEILKEYDLSYDDILDGNTGAGRDGGIDGIYFFINEELIQEDTDFSKFPNKSKFEAHVIQSKNSKSFSEGVIDKFILTSEDIFDLEKKYADHIKKYNTALSMKADLFSNSYIALATKIRKASFNYYYVNIGDTSNSVALFSHKIQKLKKTINKLINPVDFNFNFFGARELIEQSRKEPSQEFVIKLVENHISTSQDGYICLVNLKEYYDFICDEKNRLRKNIFEANVRDYQGDVVVNKGILNSLEGKSDSEFWWLNNGITILCENVTGASKQLVLTNPQIVNGLQTSNVIFNYFADKNTASDARNILVRIIVTENEQTRDLVINATNSQTSIPIASLRATDPIHRDIESFLLTKGLFYERKKNYYKNLKKQIKKTIGIPYLAQSVMSCFLLRSDDARARPSTLLKNDSNYKKVFNPVYPVELYYNCIMITKSVETFLKTIKPSLTTKDINNLKYHISMLATLTVLGHETQNPNTFKAFPVDALNNNLLEKCLSVVKDLYQQLGGDDKASKSKLLTKNILTNFKNNQTTITATSPARP